jgi:hypothetical protein
LWLEGMTAGRGWTRSRWWYSPAGDRVGCWSALSVRRITITQFFAQGAGIGVASEAMSGAAVSRYHCRAGVHFARSDNDPAQRAGPLQDRSIQNRNACHQGGEHAYRDPT